MADNVFTRKVGPLPLWGWLAIATGVAIVYAMYAKNKSGSSQAASPSTVNTPGGVDASLVPQFVNQTYTNVQPPASPPVTSSVPTSSTGSPLNEILKAGHVINANPGQATVGWTIAQKTPNATQLQVVINGPGKKNQTRYIPASATTATFSDLAPGHTYDIAVTPLDAQGQAVGGPNNINLVTSKSK